MNQTDLVQNGGINQTLAWNFWPIFIQFNTPKVTLKSLLEFPFFAQNVSLEFKQKSIAFFNPTLQTVNKLKSLFIVCVFLHELYLINFLVFFPRELIDIDILIAFDYVQ